MFSLTGKNCNLGKLIICVNILWIFFFSDKNIEFYDKNAKMNIPSPGRRPVDIREVSSPSLQTDQSTK